MLQIGRTSVWFSEGKILCESATGDVHGNLSVKHKLITVVQESDSRFLLQTNKGDGYISFQEAGENSYTVELKLPRRFFGCHRFYGGCPCGQVTQAIGWLKQF